MSAYICSVGLGIPNHSIKQSNVKNIVKEIFQSYSERELERLLTVFDHAEIEERQFVVNEDWFLKQHRFEEKNEEYVNSAQQYSLLAIDQCLNNSDFLKERIPYEDIDLIVYVSSTGISTPSMEVHLMNRRPFREDVKRMPLWGLGCGGGAIGLSHIFHWLQANPNSKVLLICCELCSLTFQKDDMRKSNLVGTALFGDGVAAALLTNDESVYRQAMRPIPNITETSSKTKKNSEHIMGWNVTDNGFEVVFSKSIPAQVKTVWKDHIKSFLENTNVAQEDIYSFIAHPGGKKVLEAMEETLSISRSKIYHSHEVLRRHGNMSSATVLYVLNEWMKETVPKQTKSIISALGPGFSSELLMIDWE
ncbi:type III polyketide synthase [Ornithinibacillus halophilus]|uniref:15-methylpalmitoyl-4-hydroxy-2-pyrone synthase n=1 Tax=Ornithinibacillus halophilus TaxID=930117 RepID=A0A1M5CLE0_9BACI|nr:3-oxoacyl-[acyl-carrier-protein] synthase III C-terminal domain-containing protein [Ornithinibacillus halophilus]SHF55529.1 15-methylpalmitoyl-4-hydroxy-2-pyrone synthase [Ornithinibacillus halophilus]